MLKRVPRSATAGIQSLPAPQFTLPSEFLDELYQTNSCDYLIVVKQAGHALSS
jgi:hypothetical protein